VEYDKGDLVLVSDGDLTTSCVILSDRFDPTFSDNSFYYTYCIETGKYGIVYENEVISLVVPNFSIDVDFESQIFDNHYNYYSDLYEKYSYIPIIFPLVEESSEED